MTGCIGRIFTITNRITAGLSRIERAMGFLEAATLSENWVREMGIGRLCWKPIIRPIWKARG